MLDHASFVDAYDRHVDDVYGFVGYRVLSGHDAEDITQQTFERALRAWDSFDPDKGSLKTWLLAIARNLVIDYHRRDRSSTEDSLPHADAQGSAQAHPQGLDLGLAADLANGLATLGQRDREVLALRFGGDLTGPEIAELLGLSLANVQQIVSRSLRSLRAAIEGNLPQASGPTPAVPSAATARQSTPDTR